MAEDTVKDLVEILIKTASSSATILERLEKFKEMNQTVAELKSSVADITKAIERMPEDPGNVRQNFSELFVVMRDIQAKSSVIEAMAQETIPNIRNHLSDINTTLQKVSDEMVDVVHNSGCPLNEVIDELSNDAGLLGKEMKENKSVLENFRSDMTHLQIQMAQIVVTPKWVWVLIGSLILIIVALIAPDLFKIVVKTIS